MEEPEENSIVRCYGCEAQVRARATELQPTGEIGELERWCLECLRAIDSFSSSLLPAPEPQEDPDFNLDNL